jgi:uncharacterized protein (DUF2147 family)
MRRTVPRLLATMLAVMVPAASYAQQKLPEDELIGDWALPTDGLVIHTYRCGDAFCGQIVKVADPERRDLNNPDPELRGRPLLGIVIAPSLYKNGSSTWSGRVYNAINGYSYNSTLNLIDKNHFTLHNCLIGSLICHTKSFYRVAPPPPSKRQKPPASRRVVSSDRVEVATPPVSLGKVKPAARKPTRSDFEAFLRSRNATDLDTLTEEQRQVLFKEFLAWWDKR